MRILCIGDIAGDIGVLKVKQELNNIIEHEKIDFGIANAENSADGMGITEKIYKQLIDIGVNVITMGNHTWGKKDIFKIINSRNLLIPANYSKNVPGNRYGIYKCKDKKICVINLIGRVDINVLSDNPFTKVEEIIKQINNLADIIIIDFHAEATAEKIAMGYFLDGKVNLVYGTHTHVQTADEKILNNGTAYITDIGMTGPANSVIGMDKDASIKRFVTSLPERYKVANSEAMFNGCILDINDEDCRTTKINRINL